MLPQLAAKMCRGPEAPKFVAESLSKFGMFDLLIKPLKITDVRGGYHFGLCCPGGGSAFLGCEGRGGGSFSISSVGEVRISSGTTH